MLCENATKIRIAGGDTDIFESAAVLHGVSFFKILIQAVQNKLILFSR